MTSAKLRAKARRRWPHSHGREAIFNAALKAFARGGFEGASLPKIAKEAHIAHPLIHYHFGSKEGLWRETIAHAFATLKAELMDQDMHQLMPIDRFRKVITGLVQFAYDHPDHVAILFTEGGNDSDRSNWLVETCMRPLYDFIEETLEAAVQTGEMKNVPTVHLASIILGSVTMFSNSRPVIEVLYRLDTMSVSMAEAHAEWLIDLLLNGLVCRGANVAENDQSGRCRN